MNKHRQAFTVARKLLDAMTGSWYAAFAYTHHVATGDMRGRTCFVDGQSNCNLLISMPAELRAVLVGEAYDELDIKRSHISHDTS